MGTKMVVFSMDNIIWNLYLKLSRMTDVSIMQFSHFSIPDCPDMTDYEKEKVITAMNDPATYKNIEFDWQLVNLINYIHNKCKDVAVHLVSDCPSEEIKEIKKAQLIKALEIPDYRIHLTVNQKRFPENMFLFICDNPHDIMMADARHKIMPARPHNDVMKKKRLNYRRVDRPANSDDLAGLIMHYIHGSDGLRR